MPVIRVVPQDPTDLVIQGEEMRQSAIAGGMHTTVAPPYLMEDVFSGGIEPPRAAAPIVIAGAQAYPPMAPDAAPPVEVLRSPFDGTMIGNNMGISTPCGAIYPHDIGMHLMTSFQQSTVRWSLVGITRDQAGATLGNCRVIVMETGRLSVNGAPIVAEAVSDGSGNYAIAVPLNTSYQVVAYKTGSPDVAGVSLQTLTPAAA